jgi:hypothetical protein
MQDFIGTIQRLERHAKKMWELLETKLQMLQRLYEVQAWEDRSL